MPVDIFKSFLCFFKTSWFDRAPRRRSLCQVCCCCREKSPLRARGDLCFVFYSRWLAHSFSRVDLIRDETATKTTSCVCTTKTNWSLHFLAFVSLPLSLSNSWSLGQQWIIETETEHRSIAQFPLFTIGPACIETRRRQTISINMISKTKVASFNDQDFHYTRSACSRSWCVWMWMNEDFEISPNVLRWFQGLG